MKNLIQKYKHAWILSYAFIYIPWFLFLEKTVTKNYYIMHIKLDDYIPFNEYFIVPYLLWFLYVAGTILFFLFTNKQDYYKVCAFLFTGMTISLLICTFFQNGTDLRPVVDPSKNVFSWLVSKLHDADTSTNVFPSIHAYNSIGIHIAIVRSEALKKHRLVRCLSGILMVSICLSTVFLKQHSAIDVFGSIVMAYMIYPFVYGSIYAWSQKRSAQKVLS